MAVNRTILILEGLPMAHLKAYVPNFPKHMRERSQSLKLWVLDLSEVRWSEKVAAQNAVFSAIFEIKRFLTAKPSIFDHSVIHIRKAVHLRIPIIRFKVHFRHPMKRQNFRDTVAQKCNPDKVSYLCYLCQTMCNYAKKNRWKSSNGQINCFAVWRGWSRRGLTDIEELAAWLAPWYYNLMISWSWYHHHYLLWEEQRSNLLRSVRFAAHHEHGKQLQIQPFF